MYQSQEQRPKTKKKQQPKTKWKMFLRDFAMGKHLLKSWRKWLGWVVVLTVIAIIFIYNERSIEAKQNRIEELEDTHRKLMLKLKDVNDVVLTEEPAERAEARAEGFEDVREYDYYVIPRKK
ncbi:MAG: hypothetical protein MJZ70_04175 [Bacteroidales bacterium]|nr:hypothetical protein [Bacteroidales bacterium]